MQTPIKELMSHPVIPLPMQATISDALILMKEKDKENSHSR